MELPEFCDADVTLCRSCSRPFIPSNTAAASILCLDCDHVSDRLPPSPPNLTPSSEDLESLTPPPETLTSISAPPPTPTPTPASEHGLLYALGLTTIADISSLLDLFGGAESSTSVIVDDGHPSTPASQSFIRSLKVIKLTDTLLKGLSTTSSSCAICTDDFKLEDSVYNLPCRHWFHGDCIIPWLGRKNNCPLCRHEFPNTEERASENLPAAVTPFPPVRRRRGRRLIRITRINVD